MKTKSEAESTYARLADAIRRTGYNREMFIEQGIVISEFPLQIELDDEIVIDAEDLIIAEHLTAHTRTARLNNSSTLTEIHFDGALEVGDRVIIIADDDTDEYFVVDKAVDYDVTE